MIFNAGAILVQKRLRLGGLCLPGFVLPKRRNEPIGFRTAFIGAQPQAQAFPVGGGIDVDVAFDESGAFLTDTVSCHYTL